MRKVTYEITTAFINGYTKTMGNSHVSASKGGYAELMLHGNVIAKRESGQVSISDAGWQSTTTKERLNGLLENMCVNLRIYQKDYVWYISNGAVSVEMQDGFETIASIKSRLVEQETEQ